MTLGDFYDCVDGYSDRLKDIDMLNYALGNYVALGVNNPKKYPKTPLLSKDDDLRSKYMNVITSDEQLDRLICEKAKK